MKPIVKKKREFRNFFRVFVRIHGNYCIADYSRSANPQTATIRPQFTILVVGGLPTPVPVPAPFRGHSIKTFRTSEIRRLCLSSTGTTFFA